MRKILIYLIVMVFFSVNLTVAQQLYVGFGWNVSKFDYKNSQGQSLGNLLSKPSNYLNVGYRHHINNGQTLSLSIGASYNGYGAIGSDNRLDNYFEWDVSYLGVNAGLDIRLFRIRDFSFYLKGSGAVEFLIRGNQIINNQVFNLVGEDEFNNNIFFVRGGLMIQHPISQNTSLFASYNYGRTVLIGKGNATDQEKLNLNIHQFGIGLIINLPTCNCPFQ